MRFSFVISFLLVSLGLSSFPCRGEEEGFTFKRGVHSDRDVVKIRQNYTLGPDERIHNVLVIGGDAVGDASEDIDTVATTGCGTV